MKTIIFFRHAKSSWDSPVDDLDRPLTLKGIADAYASASALKKLDLSIDSAYASPANRAMHTASIAMRSLELPLNRLCVAQEVYDFSGNVLLSFIRELPNQLQTVLIFGHNNALTSLCNALGSKEIDTLPTAGISVISFNEKEWNTVVKGITKQTIFPKDL